MGNIFVERKIQQSRGTGSFCQIQRLYDYRGEYRKAWEREKNMRCLKYFLLGGRGAVEMTELLGFL